MHHHPVHAKVISKYGQFRSKCALLSLTLPFIFPHFTVLIISQSENDCFSQALSSFVCNMHHKVSKLTVGGPWLCGLSLIYTVCSAELQIYDAFDFRSPSNHPNPIILCFLQSILLTKQHLCFCYILLSHESSNGSDMLGLPSVWFKNCSKRLPV